MKLQNQQQHRARHSTTSFSKGNLAELENSNKVDYIGSAAYREIKTTRVTTTKKSASNTHAQCVHDLKLMKMLKSNLETYRNMVLTLIRLKLLGAREFLYFIASNQFWIEANMLKLE